jgi:hypothetical protein
LYLNHGETSIQLFRSISHSTSAVREQGKAMDVIKVFVVQRRLQVSYQATPVACVGLDHASLLDRMAPAGGNTGYLQRIEQSRATAAGNAARRSTGDNAVRCTSSRSLASPASLSFSVNTADLGRGAASDPDATGALAPPHERERGTARAGEKPGVWVRRAESRHMRLLEGKATGGAAARCRLRWRYRQRKALRRYSAALRAGVGGDEVDGRAGSQAFAMVRVVRVCSLTGWRPATIRSNGEYRVFTRSDG